MNNWNGRAREWGKVQNTFVPLTTYISRENMPKFDQIYNNMQIDSNQGEKIPIGPGVYILEITPPGGIMSADDIWGKNMKMGRE